MNRTPSKRRTLAWGSGFFVYGALVHLLLLRCYVRWAYSGAVDTTFVNHPLTNVALPMLGGICVSFFMLRFQNKISGSEGISTTHLVVGAGLRAMGATVLTLELFYVLASAYLAVFHSNADAVTRPPVLGRFAGALVLWLISIQTYGVQAVALSLPFSFLYGTIAGAAITETRGRETRGQTGRPPNNL